jgi:hypothetical protein
MGWRTLLRKIPILERRWIPQPTERDAHDVVVRDRLQPDPPAARPDLLALPPADADEPEQQT